MIEEIIKKYYKVIFRYSRAALNGDISAAEDVTQEVFFALHRKSGTLDIGKNIKLWLYRAADLEIKNYIRKHPFHLSVDELPEDMFPSFENYFFITSDMFGCLSEDEKHLLIDYYTFEDKKEVARVHNMKLSKLYMRVYRIRLRLVGQQNIKR